MLRRSMLAQGAYYLATGVAPFVSRRAFEAVTGGKREWWLVQTVGVLVTAVGGGIVAAAARDRVTPEIAAIAAGCAGGLAAVDVVYVMRGRISPAYLADAGAQLALLAAHGDALRATRGRRRAASSTSTSGP
jgi:hypothetical protein